MLLMFKKSQKIRLLSLFFITVLLEPEDVDDFEDSNRIDNQQSDKPLQLIISAAFPKGYTLPGKRPDDDGYQESWITYNGLR
jgi:hypothetical protein